MFRTFPQIFWKVERFLALILSSFWGTVRLTIALSLLIWLGVMQSAILGHFESHISHEFVFSNAVPLASFNNTVTNTVDFRVITHPPAQLVKYVSVSHNVLPLGILKRNIINKKTAVIKIPLLPEGDWTIANVGVVPNGEQITITRASCEHLPSVKNIWHNNTIDFLDLAVLPTPWSTKHVKLVSSPHLATPGNTAVMKFAEFAHNISVIDKETEIYQHLQGSEVAPRFLGHVTENRGSRVVGFLIEYVEPRPQKGVPNLFTGARDERCNDALASLHELGIAHNDAYPRNCLIRQNGKAVLIDFDQATRGKGDFSRDMALMNTAA
ncbi:hypothetical protein RRF57_000902 [Xylaria bambusicola]|uniref:Protein kinase domain-containing protein n=1 Tax=Xylaria bambusicola TaxID=326684 RepID=A0AAN7UGJ0_9PEZI